MKDTIIIFSDGSSRGNPGPGGWGAIVMQKSNIKYQKEEMQVTELGGGEKHTTNNRMELLGAINALSSLGSEASKLEIAVNTDSSYVINGITKWVYGWQKNGWKSSIKQDVVNRDLWEKLIEVSRGKLIKWNQIGGHVGIPGNERCDEIATSYADGQEVKLFTDKLSNYEFDLSDTKGSGIKVKSSAQGAAPAEFGGQGSASGGKKSKKPAYSYLSLVHGVLKIDKTWAECEKRVKGVKGDVKFKKATSPSEEAEIIKEWTNMRK